MYHRCNGKIIPGTVVRETSTNEIVLVLEEAPAAKTSAIPQEIRDTFPLDGGFTAYTQLILPSDYSPSGSYPVLVEVYGGPGSQNVNDAPLLGTSWAEQLVEDYGIAYIFIDGRGTGFQSNEHMFQMNRALGTVEIADQISVVQQMAAKYSFLDMTRTGIWGWSYGGYNTAMVMATDTSQVYKCGK